MIQDITYELNKQMLNATNLRQQTIAHNITNVNTKNYKSKYVEFESELKSVLENQNVYSTMTNQTKLKDELLDITPTVKQSSETSSMNADGNNVDIDLEMANMAANQIQYDTLIRQVSDRLNNYHYVIRGN